MSNVQIIIYLSTCRTETQYVNMVYVNMLEP